MSRKTKALEFVDESYQIHVHGRNVLVTEAMKNYAIEKVSKIERITDRIIDVVVTMDIQRGEHRVDIVMKVGHLKIKSQGVGDDMYGSVDRAVHKLERQIRKWKTKIQNHQAKPISVIDMNVNVIKAPVSPEEDLNDQIEEENQKELERLYRPHEIVAKETRPLKTLTNEEALMKLELSGDFFLLYRCEEDLKLKVIYRKNDGNYGIIEPEA